MSAPLYLRGTTHHARLGDIRNAFTYSVDYVLVDPDAPIPHRLMARNGVNLWALRDRDYGADGRTGPAFARSVFEDAGLSGYDLRLLTQPVFAGYVFNPVSFWLALRGTQLIAVLAEVNNTFGDRHSYLCHMPDFAPVSADDHIAARKLMHVSPFQQVAGAYDFTFDIRADRLSIRILHKREDEGVLATLAGPLTPLRDRHILAASLRRPLGALRTSILIYWQALKLKLKGAPYRTRPTPPDQEVSTCSHSHGA